MAIRRLYTVTVYKRWMDRPEKERPVVSALRHQAFMERHHVLFERTFDLTGTPYRYADAFASAWVESGCPASDKAIGRRVPPYARVRTLWTWEQRLRPTGYLLWRQVDDAEDQGNRAEFAHRFALVNLANAPGLQLQLRSFARTRDNLAARLERERLAFEAELDFVR